MKYYIHVLKNYANFEGRARRAEYWQFFGINILISVVLGLIDGAIGLVPFGLGQIYSLGLFIPSIAVAIRRMHDVGKSGWYSLIPFYNFYLAVTEGTSGNNEYGVDPKGGGMDIDNFGIKEEFED